VADLFASPSGGFGVPRAITDERVYGVWTDELDIEQVRVHALRRDSVTGDIP